MRGRKPSFSLEVTDNQRADLLRWQRSTTCPAGLARRGRLILLLHDGHCLTEAAWIAGLAPNNARKRVRRFLAQGVAGLDDRPGRGRQPVFSPRGRAALGEAGL
jgi:Helix-turn-helix domain